MILFDLPVYQFFISTFGLSSLVISCMKLITAFGSSLVIIMGIVSVALLVKDKKYFKVLLMGCLIGIIFNNLLKIIIRRPRPTETLMLTSSNTYSFPSGHAMMSMIFYGLLIYFISKNVKRKSIKNLLMFLLSVLILMIGISRIYLGIHYATDVIGAFIIGFIYLCLFLKFCRKKYNI